MLKRLLAVVLAVLAVGCASSPFADSSISVGVDDLINLTPAPDGRKRLQVVSSVKRISSGCKVGREDQVLSATEVAQVLGESSTYGKPALLGENKEIIVIPMQRAFCEQQRHQTQPYAQMQQVAPAAAYGIQWYNVPTTRPIMVPQVYAAPAQLSAPAARSMRGCIQLGKGSAIAKYSESFCQD